MATSARREWDVMIPPWFLMLPRSELSGRAKLLMIAIAAKARSKRYCWASTEALAVAAGLCESSARKALREMVARGWVVRAMAPTRRVRRVGLILVKRPDSRRWPVAEDAAQLEIARIDLGRDRAAWEAKLKARRSAGPIGTAN